MPTTMSSRERVRRLINHQEADRVAIRDEIWVATQDRWRRQGLPQDVPANDYFGFELRLNGADLTPRLRGRRIHHRHQPLGRHPPQSQGPFHHPRNH